MIDIAHILKTALSHQRASELAKAAEIYHRVLEIEPFPFGGGTVSYEALWMGVPIVTLAGEVFMGRLTGSLPHRLGLNNCVNSSGEDYVTAAKQLADDLEALADIRQGLRARAIETIAVIDFDQ